MSAPGAAALAIEGGNLTLGGGLLALVRPALRLLECGGKLAVRSTAGANRDNLPRWCRLNGHRYESRETQTDGAELHLITRGPHPELRGERPRPAVFSLGGGLSTAEMLRAFPQPEAAVPESGFAPRGARFEAGGPAYPFTLLERDLAGPPDVAELYDQAVSNQWSAVRDIAWHELAPLPPPVETALGQTLTFLAENELSALYLPSKFISQLHPAFAETAMFLATQLMDEARHIDVFLKRARAAGGTVGVSSVVTSQSLLSLLNCRDFLEAAFLLSVLGEGTFVDLLRFVERYAPDEVTADIMRRARNDETRHVHFGMAHVRHALSSDPALHARFEEAVRRRAATLSSVSGAPEALQDSLIVLAGGGDGPKEIAAGFEAYRQLLADMEANRIRRLESAGFAPEAAKRISDLHTPNFM